MIINQLYSLLQKLLFRLPAETAHDLSLTGLDWTGQMLANPPAPLPVKTLGLNFSNPVGLAAGLDKNGDHIDALLALGFGFIEIGTTTPKPQPGNPRPRLFRLPEARAVINRLGFNNKGVAHLVRRVERSRKRNPDAIIGINIGKNKTTPNERAVDDYLHCLNRVYPLASYITINISSPNTENLRDLQHRDALLALLMPLCERRQQLADMHGDKVPLLVKLAPDLEPDELDSIAAVITETGMHGVICGNTTITRPDVDGLPHADETGGLSGAPLKPLADKLLQGMRQRLPAEVPIIGVGGITLGSDARDKFAAGATLVQFYTGMVYRGPELIAECVNALRDGVKTKA